MPANPVTLLWRLYHTSTLLSHVPFLESSVLKNAQGVCPASAAVLQNTGDPANPIALRDKASGLKF